MADSKISALTALVAADVVSSDVLPIVDTSATTTKKISLSDLIQVVVGGSSVNALSDVTIFSATTNQVLRYNGTAWVNSAPTGYWG
jgi:hypothetical protein